MKHIIKLKKLRSSYRRQIRTSNACFLVSFQNWPSVLDFFCVLQFLVTVSLEQPLPVVQYCGFQHQRKLYDQITLSHCFKLPKTLWLRRMVGDFYNLRPGFVFLFSTGVIQCALCVHMCSSTDGDSNDYQTLWCEFKFPEGVGMSVKHQMPFCLRVIFF